MSKTNYSEKRKKDLRIQGVFLCVLVSVLLITMLIFVIYSLISDRPIERSEAVSVSGYFDYYETSDDNERILFLEDGTRLIINSIIYNSED